MEFNKTTDLIEMVATKLTTEENKVSKTKAKAIVEAVVDSMKELIMDESKDGLDIYGFTKWEVREVPERTARNPQTGETIMVERHNQLKAKVSSALKQAVR